MAEISLNNSSEHSRTRLVSKQVPFQLVPRISNKIDSFRMFQSRVFPVSLQKLVMVIKCCYSFSKTQPRVGLTVTIENGGIKNCSISLLRNNRISSACTKNIQTQNNVVPWGLNPKHSAQQKTSWLPLKPLQSKSKAV